MIRKLSFSCQYVLHLSMPNWPCPHEYGLHCAAILSMSHHHGCLGPTVWSPLVLSIEKFMFSSAVDAGSSNFSQAWTPRTAGLPSLIWNVASNYCDRSTQSCRSAKQHPLHRILLRGRELLSSARSYVRVIYLDRSCMTRRTPLLPSRHLVADSAEAQ